MGTFQGRMPGVWLSLLLVLTSLLAVACNDDVAKSNASVIQAISQKNKAKRQLEADDLATKTTSTFQLLEPQLGEYTQRVMPTRQAKEKQLFSLPVNQLPVIDGLGDDAVWREARKITTRDFASQREIVIQSVHTQTTIYFLVSFPDGAPSTTHKTWIWDSQEEIYRTGNDREDAFVFKWSLDGNQANLSFHHPEPHHADIWFWKACRGNPSGYLDDKYQRLSARRSERTMVIQSPDGSNLYLLRAGDPGTSAYDEQMPFEYAGHYVPKYYPRQSQGSRADVQGKGQWRDGQWTIEIQRALNTGFENDVVFQVGGQYLFAVSCYEMAGSGVNSKWTQPLYRQGDAFDKLMLVVK